MARNLMVLSFTARSYKEHHFVGRSFGVQKSLWPWSGEPMLQVFGQKKPVLSHLKQAPKNCAVTVWGAFDLGPLMPSRRASDQSKKRYRLANDGSKLWLGSRQSIPTQ